MTLRLAVLAMPLAAAAWGQAPPADVQAKVEAKARQLASWGSDPAIVAAVKAYNAAAPAEAKAMTNEKWKALTILDPFVRSFTRNPAAGALKARKDAVVTEAFVSGADGGKVAFLAKTTAWNHKGKPKHDVPMSGKRWIGPVEVDESTGLKQVQVAVPVLEGDKPIGSIVVGLGLASL